MTRGSILVPVKSGILYCVIVFGAGFALGPIRLLWAVPHFGARTAELMEMPVMLVVVIVAARSIVRRLAVSPALACRLGMGGIALALLVGTELALALPCAASRPASTSRDRIPCRERSTWQCWERSPSCRSW